VTVKITKTKAIWQKTESLSQIRATHHLHSPNGSIEVTVWLQFPIRWSKYNSKSGTSSHTMCQWTPELYLSNGTNRMVSAEIDGIAYAAKAIPPQKHLKIS